MRDSAKGGALTEVTFMILLALYRPRHGYAVMQMIGEETQGRLVLGAGTLYGALNALQEKGWIEPDRGGAPQEAADRKKAYVITRAGREAAERELQRLERLTATARKIIGGEA